LKLIRQRAEVTEGLDRFAVSLNEAAWGAPDSDRIHRALQILELERLNQVAAVVVGPGATSSRLPAPPLARSKRSVARGSVMTSCKDSAPSAPAPTDLEQIADLLDEHWERPQAALPLSSVRPTDFDPWWGQRLALRSRATWRVLVTARQVGKSYLAVHLSIQVALERPGTLSVLLVPTLRHARQPIAILRARCRTVPGCHWNASDRRMAFPNGSTWEAYSGEREGSTRALTITGLLWADEAALIPLRAWNEILPASGNALKLLTTTPAGKNWDDEFVSLDDAHDSFRFRSADSPHVNHAEVARCRESMTTEFAAQEGEGQGKRENNGRPVRASKPSKGP